MIVPQFWAESRIQKRVAGRQFTVRRFGWSDLSQQAAEAHAEQRAAEAFDQVLVDPTWPRRELKVKYNGAEGLPIREEIVDRLGNNVVTRNSYGARCLNTPDVFFADLDFDHIYFNPTFRFIFSLLTSLALAMAAKFYFQTWTSGLLTLLMAPLILEVLINLLEQLMIFLSGDPAVRLLSKVERFVRVRPEWHLRVYRTPNGLRLLAMHATFDPTSPEVQATFRHLGVDPVYSIMCLRQNCFRARLTAKPWRVGIQEHLGPRPGVWPIVPARLGERKRWVEHYEKQAQPFAACRFVKAVGAIQRSVPAANSVQAYHDQACRATQSLPLA